MESETQQKLRAYNLADCEALELLAKVLWGLSCPEESPGKPQNGNPVFVTASLSSGFSHPDWRKFEGALPELDRINDAAQWDYQQDRIYLRTKEYSRRRVKKRQTGGSSIERVDKVINSPECPVCPKCLGASRKKMRKVSYQLQELVFGRSSVKRRTVKQDFQELKQLVHDFASLLNPMIETIDRHGLKRRFLNKHLKSVDRFYKDLSLRENCITFLRHNGVPWNNNNAEHAIKAYARSRVMFQGAPSAKSMSEYLVLLSICETCRFRGIDFLDFLRSGERDVEAFAKSKRPKPPDTY